MTARALPPSGSDLPQGYVPLQLAADDRTERRMTVELERGDIYFFYRPRVNVDEVRSLDDVQRLFFVLHVDGTHRLRDIIVGTKHLPGPDSHERVWAFVAQVSDRAEDLQSGLRQ